MDIKEVVLSVFIWIGFLFFLYWYANKHRHSERKPLNAFGLLLGIVILVIAVLVGLGVYLETNYGKLHGGATRGIAIAFGFIVVIPAWNYAKSKIKQAPKNSA